MTSRRAGFILASFVFLVGMYGTTLPTPLYPLFQARYGFGELLVTIVFSIYAFGVVAGLLLFGALSDEVGRRPILAVGLVFSAASALIFTFTNVLEPIYVARILSGLAAGIFNGTATAYLVDLAPRGNRRVATLVAVAVNLGGLGTGTLVAGLLADHAGSPLRVPFIVNLGLIGLAGIALLLSPETVERRTGRLRLQRLGVPDEVRGVFAQAAATGFGIFAVAGVYSSVAPAFLGKDLHESSHTLAGGLVTIVFFTSIVGQLIVPRLKERTALITGCLWVIAGVGFTALALGIDSLAALIAGAVAVGIGQGVVIAGGLAAINQRAPVERRGETASAFFVVMYIGLSIPVIGVGVLASLWNLPDAGIVFSVAVAALVGAVLVSFRRR
jgi:MFS family permease